MAAPPLASAAPRFVAADWGLTVGIALIWGSSFLWIAIGLESMAPGAIPLVRIALGAAALACIPVARRSPLDRADWPRVAAMALLWMALPFLLYALAEQTVSSAVTGMLNGAVPVSVALWSAVLERRWPSPQRWVALGVGVLGIVLIALPSLGNASADMRGVLYLIGAIACYGLATNLSRPLQARYSGPAVMLRTLMVGAVLALPAGLVGLSRSTFTWDAAFAMLVLGALGTGLAFVFLAALIGRTDPTRATIGIFFTPIVAVVLGVVVRDEQLDPVAVVGSAVVIVGAFLCARPEP